MKKTRNQLLAALLALAFGVAYAAAGADVPSQTRITFTNNRASVSGNVSRGQARRYVFSAQSGQGIEMVLDSESASSMKIAVVGNASGQAVADETAGETGDMTTQTFSAELPDDGDYTVTITSSDNEAAPFRLNLTRN